MSAIGQILDDVPGLVFACICLAIIGVIAMFARWAMRTFREGRR